MSRHSRMRPRTSPARSACISMLADVVECFGALNALVFPAQESHLPRDFDDRAGGHATQALGRGRHPAQRALFLAGAMIGLLLFGSGARGRGQADLKTIGRRGMAAWSGLVLCPPSLDGKKMHMLIPLSPAFSVARRWSPGMRGRNGISTKMQMIASRFPAQAERAASGVAPLSKAVRQMAIFCRPSGHVRHSGKDCRWPHRFGNLCHAAAATAPVRVCDVPHGHHG
jgi:hypothetical protein